ncbi:MAG TPA: FAD-dependent oxidoreductase [Polyangiaceae bacterium]|nr:FAD-dependent oxidoreductase [Polyangiaceae bacterium]
MVSLPEQVELSVGLDDAEDDDALRQRVARQLGVGSQHLPRLRLLKRSLDARRGRVQFHLLFALGEGEDGLELAPRMPREPTVPADQPPIVVVGDGPAGLFAAYELARRGQRVVVVDRGKTVQPRRRDLKLLNARGGVDPDSNYCFGEGGAGTYSDGKLYTRSHKRGDVRDVLEVLALHGAPPNVLTEARPHIGSNLLPKIVEAMRERLAEVGVEFRFGRRLVGLEVEARGGGRAVTGVRLERVDEVGAEARHEELATRAVILATGHSARDVYELLAKAGVALEAKSFALGVRIEHPQQAIDRIQFGKHAGHPKLGAASYKLVEQVGGRGVFSFCMCPGGWIVPAMTDGEHLVVNGMSLSKRDSAFANSGLVVGVELDDYAALGLRGEQAGIEVQRRAEHAAQVAGGGQNRAPATRVSDFLAGRASADLPATSYLPGLTATDVGAVLDATGLGLADRLRNALRAFDRQMRGYVTSEAILVGVESRTSSPVRVPREADTLQSPSLLGLFPTGEGAGYAGGIVSAAVDGLRVAERAEAFAAS